MNPIQSIAVLCCLATFSGWAQGTLVFDQQSSVDEVSSPGAGGALQNYDAAQSFTPSLAAMDFVRLKMRDEIVGNGIGAMLHVEVHSDAADGPVLSSTDPVVLLDGFAGVAHLSFSAPVGLTPGEVYFLAPQLTPESDRWSWSAWEFDYGGGSAWVDGVAAPGSDFWFREGITVPEPSTVCLGLFGLASLALGHRGRRRGRAANTPNEH